VKLLLIALLCVAQTPDAEPAKTVDSSPLLDCLYVNDGILPISDKLEASRLAALEGDIDAIRNALANSADYDPWRALGDLSLPYAAVGGHPDTVALLLAARADPTNRLVYEIDSPAGLRTVRRTPREAVLACSAIDPAAPSYATVIALLEEAEAAFHDRSTRAETALLAEDFDAIESILREGPISRAVGGEIVTAVVEKDLVSVLQRLVEINNQKLPGDSKDIRRLSETHPSELTASENFIRDYYTKTMSRLFVHLLRENAPHKAETLNRLENDSTVLMNAARYGVLEQVKALLEAGADPDIKNAEGKTALDLVCAMSTSEDCKEIRRLLQQKGSSSSGIAAIKDIPAAYLAAPVLLALAILILAHRRYKGSNARHLVE